MLAIAQGMTCVALSACGGGSDDASSAAASAGEEAEREQWAGVDAQEPTLTVDASSSGASSSSA